ncbi:LOW QUALITY PROTEIN: shikimate O-hydroxycinnamoyltransferase [Cinnamomum micranthum f. kanehirae]|uniref:Shikimate O-hydroxycinnamoyltransferase n=1 Tax=Cinnamomum micranthum f. kanehirae TaxID=337451 RepID=A0A443P0T2_9MAGN|nr:LOW QUALITY PROTEIN: shikimate O-hydroxycinnamoyltransferase [Cinnamomum micranthum f. kanehirae]
MEAYADVELRELQLYNPDASVEGKLVPKKKDGVLYIQVTELRCGSVIVACTFDHRIANAYSGNMFLVAWAEMGHSENISLHPSFQRSLLNPRRPGSCDASLDDMYVPLSTLPPPSSNGMPRADPVISRIYYVTAENITRLQDLASSKGCRRTKLESLGAYLWQIVAKSEMDSTKRCKMGVVVDGRTRLCDGKNSVANYFGNVLSIPFGEETVEELVKKPLSWVADTVHEYVHVAAEKEHFLGLIDWVEAHWPEPALAKIYCKGIEDGSAFVRQRFPVEKLNFGWGRPVFGSYHFPLGGESGYVMPMPSVTQEGNWVVYVHLLKGQIEVLEEVAGDVFKPLTPEYLGLHGDATKFSKQTSFPSDAFFWGSS